MDINGCTCTCPAETQSPAASSFVGTRAGFPGLGPAATSQDDPLIFNMTNASNDPRFRIQDIVHQMFLEVNEEGTETAAVSVGTIDYAATKTFRIDRPFTLFVRHESTLATIFWATIVNPVA